MREIITFEKPSRFIMHFASEEGVSIRQIYYQVEIDPHQERTFSPTGDFVRFNHETSEVHGWVPVDEIVVDEILEVRENGEWREFKGEDKSKDGKYQELANG